MADRVLAITWGQTVRGREDRGLEVFNEAVGFYGRAAQDGRIEAFDVCVLDPNARLNGFMTLKGSREQLSALRADREFRRLMADAALIVDELAMHDGSCDEGVADQVALLQEAVGKVPQMR
jgi:hypothetical protein